MKRSFWIAALCVSVPAQDLPQAIGDRVDVQKKAFGIVAGIVEPDRREIFVSGCADTDCERKLTKDSAFEIGSITKQFTSAAIMLLSEEGKLAVSDPMTRHLPSYPSYGQNITVEHLLTHTSGIVSYTGIPGYMASNVMKDLTVQQLIDVFKDRPVEFAPGERYAYNNSGYILLGAIVEAASMAPTRMTEKASPPRSLPKSCPMVVSSASAMPDRSRTRPMNMNKGTATSTSFSMLPRYRDGRLCRNE